MNRYRIVFPSLIVAGLFWQTSRTTAQDERAQAVVQRAIEVSGGADALATRRAMSCREKGTYFLNKESIPYRGSTRIQWPDRLRLEVEEVYTIVLNGNRGWMQTDGKFEALTAVEYDEVHQQHYARWLASLTPLTDSKCKLTYLGKSTLNGAQVDRVRAHRDGEKMVDLYFDSKTGLLLKTRTKVSTADSTENAIEEVNLFKEYKKVDGVLFPMQLVILHDGAKFAEANFYDVKLSETLPAADFTVPDSRK
jgi:hypothetical protein